MTERSVILAQLARLTAVNAAREHLADRLCEAGRRILGAAGAWITVQSGTNQHLPLSSTDDTATALESLQEILGEGPCREAFRHGVPVSAEVESVPDNRWPEFGRAAWQRVGPLTVQAFPMRPERAPLGVLGLYFAAGTTGAESTETAQFLADMIGAALLETPLPQPSDGPDSGMWSGRAEVHQATGMVMAQLRVPPDDALALLRAHAYAHDATVAEIAHQVVTRQLDFRGDA